MPKKRREVANKVLGNMAFIPNRIGPLLELFDVGCGCKAKFYFHLLIMESVRAP